MTTQDSAATQEKSAAESTAVAARTRPASFTEQFIEPFSRMRGEMNRFFEEFPSRWPSLQLDRIIPSMPVPAMEMTESDEGYKISVEVPGIEAKDIDVSVEDDVLIISGEKKAEKEEKERDCYRSERTYGSFERRLVLPQAAAVEQIKAVAKNGVLQITFPKNEKAVASKRRIDIEVAQ